MLPWQPFLAFYIWSAHWRHVKNTTEPSMCSGDTALCQITLATCLYFIFIQKIFCNVCQPTCLTLLHMIWLLSSVVYCSDWSLVQSCYCCTQSLGLHCHTSADDTQIYGSSSPLMSLDVQTCILACMNDVAAWVHSNRLQLNPTKTELYSGPPPVVDIMRFHNNN